MMFLGWVAVGLAAFVAWRVLAKGTPLGGESSPEDTLRRRYARGEIDDAEFERRMSALHHN
jgi:uncharacterized membrane protein